MLKLLFKETSKTPNILKTYYLHKTKPSFTSLVKKKQTNLQAYKIYALHL